MKPDNPASAPGQPSASDTISRAHLREPDDHTHRIHRYPADPDLRGLVQRFWIPVWSVPAGREAPQKVLQYPVTLMVISPDYARFYGVVSGLSVTTLSGDGWAVGVMLEPAAGALVTRGSVSAYTDRHVDLAEVLGPSATDLVAAVRDAMEVGPDDPTSHRVAMDLYAGVLRRSLPVDPEGELVNRIVAHVEGDAAVLRVAQVCAEFHLTERTLQRLLQRRLGLSPKWLIQRRRLQEAAERLRASGVQLGQVAADLGYADQAHFSRDFHRVTAMTPGEFARRWRGGHGAAR